MLFFFDAFLTLVLKKFKKVCSRNCELYTNSGIVKIMRKESLGTALDRATAITFQTLEININEPW